MSMSKYLTVADFRAAQTDRIARAICREQCAFYGEPPCWLGNKDWPNRQCDEPGCHALAEAAVRINDRANPGAEPAADRQISTSVAKEPTDG